MHIMKKASETEAKISNQAKTIRSRKVLGIEKDCRWKESPMHSSYFTKSTLIYHLFRSGQKPMFHAEA